MDHDFSKMNLCICTGPNSCVCVGTGSCSVRLLVVEQVQLQLQQLQLQLEPVQLLFGQVHLQLEHVQLRLELRLLEVLRQAEVRLQLLVGLFVLGRVQVRL
ncbi:hypothetical protein JCM8202_005970 [Rhodotorula sphaerocarpa]